MEAQQEQQHLFGRREIWALLIPIMIEQLLASLMGMIDTVMVSNVGSAAISAVSLVDSINILVIQLFSALAAGGTIICSQYIGSGSRERAEKAAEQLVLTVALLSAAITAVCMIFRNPLLTLIFGKVEADVMAGSRSYFLYTGLSFPFIAVYNAGSSIFRAQKNTKTPMIISVTSNFLNIIGNAVLIWVFHLGVTGAAVSTLLSRIYCAVFVMALLRKPENELRIINYRRIRPDGNYIKRILAIGIPSGIENSMFQFGKLAIQSTVSTLGTVAIAAQAMASIMEGLNGVAGMGVGIGLMTVVGQCIGAGRDDEAAYYIKKFCFIAEICILISVLAVYAAAGPILTIAGMEPASRDLCMSMMRAITIVKPLVWVLSFIPAYGMRSAGDVKFSMMVTVVTMWVFRVSLTVYLCRFRGFGPIAVWIGMFTDWTVRGIIFTLRFRSRKWLRHRIA